MVRVLDRDDVRRLVSMADAITAVREAFAAADRGGAVMPAPFGMHLPDAGGEVHVKGAYLAGAPVFAVKTATGFYRNAELGLPVSGGMTMVHDATTGTLRMLIADGGLLTELRTAAAGAVAADLLARPGARSAAVIGTGGQARYQLQALLQGAPHRAGDGLGPPPPGRRAVPARHGRGWRTGLHRRDRPRGGPGRRGGHHRDQQHRAPDRSRLAGPRRARDRGRLRHAAQAGT